MPSWILVLWTLFSLVFTTLIKATGLLSKFNYMLLYVGFGPRRLFLIFLIIFTVLYSKIKRNETPWSQKSLWSNFVKLIYSPFFICRLVGRMVCLSLFPERAGSFTSMLLSEHLFHPSPFNVIHFDYLVSGKAFFLCVQGLSQVPEPVRKHGNIHLSFKEMMKPTIIKSGRGEE